MGSFNTRAAVFLDRDGTINEEKNYIYKYSEWEWIPGAIKAIKTLNDAGVLVVVITNQSGVARGLYSCEEVEYLHQRVNNDLKTHGAHIDAYYYCPHHPEFNEKIVCTCRKPQPGLILEAKREWNIDLNRSAIFGDKVSDINAGKAVGLTSFLVSTGYGEEQRTLLSDETHYTANILTATNLYIKKYLSVR